MKCKVEKCTFEGQNLTNHIICKHGITIADYVKKYGNDFIDEDLKKLIGDSRKSKYAFQCSICLEKFQSQKGLDYHYKESKDIKHNHYYYNETNTDSWVECNVCSLRSYSINKHIEKHNLKISDYEGELRSKQCKDDLEQKYKEIRENTFQFVCPVSTCREKYFKTKNSLYKHLVNSDDISHNHSLYNESNKDEWIECEVCHFRKIVLSMHLKKEHNMTVEYYKQNYNREVESKNYQKKYKDFIMAGVNSNKEREKKFFCIVCSEGFSTELSLKKHQESSIDHKHSSLDCNDTNTDEWVECKVKYETETCGYRCTRIDHHLKSYHNMSVEQYKEKYGGEILSSAFLEKINNNWGDSKENIKKRKLHERKCAIQGCNNVIVGEAFICSACKLKEARILQEEKFKDKIEHIDFVRCQCRLENGEVCNWPDTRISKHILHHNLTTKDYKRLYDSPVVCTSLAKSTAALTGKKHTEQTRKLMSHSQMGRIPWNAGLTKEDHPSLQSISDKATIRLSQLTNNNWSTNPVTKDRNGMYGKKTWSFGLTKETSELIEQRDEKNSDIYHHKSHYLGGNTVYDINKFVEQYKNMQKSKILNIDKTCVECGSLEELHAHHIHPSNLFDHYDLSAHSYSILITLCNSCHGKYGQLVDNAILSSKSEEDFKNRFPNAYEFYSKWKDYAENRFVSCFPIEKNFVEKLSEEQRSNLSLMIFSELRHIGFPYSSFSDEDLLKDFENIEKSSSNIQLDSNTLRNYNFSGSRIREQFVHQQYTGFLEIFENDQVLMKVIRNRLGLDWKSKPEFFNMNHKIIIKGFEVLFPDKRFSKYKATTAKWIVDNFCQGNKVFDYSAGWGDRLLGTIAAKKEYLGFDTNENLVKELNDSIGWIKKYRNCHAEVKFGNSADYKEQIEFAYSCPPYGGQEVYQGSNYSNDRDWFQKFMLPVINMCENNLVANGKFVCHLPIRLAGIVRNELDKVFQEITTVKVPNKHDAYHGGNERINEVILIYQNRV